MKKRLISRKNIKKAYRQDIYEEGQDLNLAPVKPDIDKLPKEIFEILGELVSFIEVTDKLEEDGNENK